jgi:hypothetical protein
LYKSQFERDVVVALKKNKIKFVYEPTVVHFLQPEKKRKYIPDFRLTFKKGSSPIFVEAKGRLTLADRQKMLWVRDQNPKMKFVILFMDARKRITKRSNTTYSKWAEDNNFEHYDFRNGLPWGTKDKNED